EKSDEPTEIVIHVNMLKEGWDVNNLYTIVPLRAAHARVLIEQTIGRGLRLPYGKRTGVAEVDRLSIVAHDRFQEIVDEANRDDSIIQMRQIVLQDEDLREQPRSVVIRPTIEDRLGIRPTTVTEATLVTSDSEPPLFTDEAEAEIAKVAYDVIRRLQSYPREAPDLSSLERPEIQARIVREVKATYDTGHLGLAGVATPIDITSVVQATTREVIDRTISIPRITVVPVGELRSGFHPFELDVSVLNFPPVNDALWVQSLQTGEETRIGLSAAGIREQRLEDYVISGLIDFDEVSYDDHADQLQALASRVVVHLRGYLRDDEQVECVLQVHQRTIAWSVYSQMQQHFWEDASGGFEAKVTAGFTPIKEAAVTGTGEVRNFRQAPERRSEMRSHLYGGFRRCLQTVLKFDSNPERVLAVILDRDSQKWFRPAAGQFQISYRLGAGVSDYQPDFVAELEDRIVMLEPKRADLMTDLEVLAKRDAAVVWCDEASRYAAHTGGKPWVYALISHDAILENQTLEYLLRRYAVSQGK
ncbi:MAG: type III restriction endonuclease subunit R, partial [Chloroflexia bacterium]|nr:type III restriction endonuclease subunit R [Chloroflexia bacterium]